MVTFSIASSGSQVSGNYSFSGMEEFCSFLVKKGIITEVGFLSRDDLTEEQKKKYDEIDEEDFSTFTNI